ncbi:MAG: 30S ribosomal protein S6 [Rhodospirillales bacterium]|tara:strand:- start:514 stop:975 length:462 start_codon:yes stop_codon:yes gene_type:complete
MSLYESVVIARQEISAEQVETLGDEIDLILKNNEGKTEKRENWGLRTLAYKIKKNRKGHYLLFNYECAPEVVSELERQLRLNEDVLRYLTIKIDKFSNEPSIPAQMTSRDDRQTQTEQKLDSNSEPSINIVNNSTDKAGSNNQESQKDEKGES